MNNPSRSAKLRFAIRSKNKFIYPINFIKKFSKYLNINPLMFRIKILFSISIFSILLIGTSIIKNQTRQIEKKISNLSSSILIKEKDLNETQLDLFYLTSPSIIERKIKHLDSTEYSTMEYSKIFFSMSNFLDLQNKYVIQKDENEKKSQAR